MNPFDRFPFERLRQSGAVMPPELTEHVFSACIRCAIELPEAEVRALGAELNSREADVVIKVMQLQGDAYTPLHKVVRKLSPSDLRVWDRVETRLEKMLADRGLGSVKVSEVA